jgi:hypothetical protein
VFPVANVLEFLKGVYNALTWPSALLFDLGITPQGYDVAGLVSYKATQI